MKIVLSVLIFWLLLFPQPVSAQVVINEILPNPEGGSPEDGEFIELYSDNETNISGWILDDKKEGSSPYTIPEGTVIGKDKKFLVFYKTATKITLNNDEDEVRLIKPGDNDPLDSYAYKITSAEEGISFGRVPDGSGQWVRLAEVSPERNNLPAPLPTLTSTPTIKPIPTSKPVNTSTPISTSKPTATPKITLTPKNEVQSSTTSRTATSSQEGAEKDVEVLGLRNELVGETNGNKSAQNQEEVMGSTSLAAGIFIIGGLAFLSAAGYTLYKSKKRISLDDKDEKYNSESGGEI